MAVSTIERLREENAVLRVFLSLKVLSSPTLSDQIEKIDILVGKIISALVAYTTAARREEGKKLFNGPVGMMVWISSADCELPADEPRDAMTDEGFDGAIETWKERGPNFIRRYLLDMPCRFVKVILDNAENTLVRFKTEPERHRVYLNFSKPGTLIMVRN